MSALFFLWFFFPVPVSALAFAVSSAAVLVVSADFFLRLFLGVVLPDSAFAFADSSAAPALSEPFFFELFFLGVPLSALVLALWSAAAVPALFFPLFFDPVSFALVDESDVLASDADFFFEGFFFVVVSEAEALSSEAGSFLLFWGFFFLVAVSVLWSDVLVCGFASAGTDSAIRKHKAVIHVVIRKGSLFIWVLIVRGESNGPSLKKLRRAR